MSMKRVIVVALLLLSIVSCNSTEEELEYNGYEDESFESEVLETGDSPLSEEVFVEIDQASFEKMEKQKIKDGKLARVRAMKIPFDEIYSYNVCLMDAETGEVLYGVEENKVVFPASLTKIMTTIVAIENRTDFSKTFILEDSTFEGFLYEDASMAGFLPGEEVCFEDLLYGTMMPSGADASIGLAECSTGTEADHVKAMNAKVKELGLKNTNFTNVTGLHHPENYSTAKEIGDILKYSLENIAFADVMTKSTYTSKPNPYHEDGIPMEYKIVQYGQEMSPYDYKILGGKTGFTEEAGLCLASVADINGIRYILVTLGAEMDGGSFADAVYIYDRVYEETVGLD